LALPLFAVTLFVSAFLLFLVQPMIGKMILPKLGGTPQVWNTCMLFFQTVLLAGYAYTHNLSTRLRIRIQLAVHTILLGLPIVVLLATGVFDVKEWYPDPTINPIVEALAELALIVGIPFFVVSTSAPLLQRWFVATGHPAASDPYFLYGASNLGSLLSLLFYPFLFEPWFALREQAYIWLGGYIGLIALIVACVLTVLKSPLSLQPVGAGVPEGSPEIPVPPEEPPAAPPAPQPQASTALKSGPAPGGPARGGFQRKKGLKAHRASPALAAAEAEVRPAPTRIISRPSDAPMTAWRRTRWVLLAAVPSSLMLGVTNYISTDLASAPFLWIPPLALYLLSFICVFARWPVPWTASDTSVFTPHSLVLYFLQPLSILGMCWILLVGGFREAYMYITWGAFFMTALACHGEFARDRPHPRYLTEYFLLLSVGGALGGFLNAIVAPMLFAGVYEFYIALVIACFVRPILLETNWLDNFLMNNFPNLQTWAREQSDQMSRSLGRTPDGSTYVLSFTLDVLLGLFMVLFVWFMNAQMQWGWYDMRRAINVLKFIGFTERTPNGFPGPALVYRFQALHAVIYGIPLVICGLYSSRPLRFGLAITAVLFMNLWVFRSRGEDETLFQGRTYFGVLRVFKGQDDLTIDETGRKRDLDPEEFRNFADKPGEKQQTVYNYTYLMHGTTYHGRNYTYRPDKDNVDLSRLATTYYHRYGPTGAVMEKFNWLPGPQNTYWGDLRVPATTVGNIAADLGLGTPPYGTLLNAAASEPAYATIGLGTGTMASYCRPYQHLTFYEIDSQIREFSLPPPGKPELLRDKRSLFTYLQGALRRGANLEIVMGDARLTMEHQGELADKKKLEVLYPILPGDRRTGAEGEDSDIAKLNASTMMQNREHYYKAIEVDAFSSDAIPVHLITKEAIRMYLSKITYDGVVMVHTSNRHLDLVQPVAKIVEELDDEFRAKYKGTPYERVKCLVGKDSDQRSKYLGHFSSEYVMVYYDVQYLKPAKNYALPPGNIYSRSLVEWHPPEQVAKYPWTDDYSNLWRIMR
jgi:hypothetical protein